MQLSDLNDTGMYSQPASYGVGAHINDDSGQSSSSVDIINMGAGLCSDLLLGIVLPDCQFLRSYGQI